MTPDEILAGLTTIARDVFDDEQAVLTRETTASDVAERTDK